MNNIGLFEQIFKELSNNDLSVKEFVRVFTKELFVEEYLKGLNKEEFNIVLKIKNFIDANKTNNKKIKIIVNEALKKIENLKNDG